MPRLTFRIAALVQSLDDGGLLAEPLLFPEFCCHGRSLDEVFRHTLAQVRRTLAESVPAELHRRQLAGEPEVASHRVTIPPPRRSHQWTLPVRLQVPYVRWSHGAEAVVAYVPQLQQEILAQNQKELSERLDDEIHSALVRSGSLSGLEKLVWLDRHEGLDIEMLELELDIPSPKEAARRQAKLEEAEHSVLKDVAVKLDRQRGASAYEVDEDVARLGQCLAGGQRTNVLLVGPSGVGKTAIVRQLVAGRAEHNLGEVSFWATSGSRLVAGMSGFGMWQQRCQQLVAELSKHKLAMHWGSLPELLEVGKSSCSQGIAAFLRPYLSRRAFYSIAECTAEQLAAIEKQDPQLLDAFYRLDIAEAPPAAGRRILARHIAACKPSSLQFDEEAIDKVDRLHRRFATYSAFPGRPLRFINNLLESHDRPQRISAGHVTERFSRETGLPQFLLDDDVELDIESTRQWFARRVIGQREAVDRIVDVLARVKADLSRGGRPIASFLFAGPTGVGKTEMAKAICEFMYEDPRRMVRLDLSEYSDPVSVQRLIGGLQGTTRGLLTDRVREQPFTVVLLDEFEKADPLLFDMLLQVLGEGRLTDAAGRVTDFCNSIVILTSNLGADSFGKGSLGLAAGQPSRQAADHFLKKVREFVRPEFFNRLEHLIPFSPLDRAMMETIARREIAKIKSRDGVRYRQLELTLEDDVVEHVARQASDLRYGARPLKRRLEQSLVTPLAERANKYHGDTPLSSHVSVTDGKLDVAVRAVVSDRDQLQVREDLEALQQATHLRRQAQRLEHSRLVRDMQNHHFRLQRQLERMECSARRLMARTGAPQDKSSRHEGRPAKELVAREQRRLDTRLAHANMHLEQLRTLLDAAAEIGESSRMLEEDSLMRFYASEPLDRSKLVADAAMVRAQLNDLMMQLFLHSQESRAGAVSLAIFGLDNRPVFRLGRTYAAAAGRHNIPLSWFALLAHKRDRRPPPHFYLKYAVTRDNEAQAPKDDKLRRVIDVRHAESIEHLEALGADDLLGIGMDVKGPLGVPLLAAEAGVHEFKADHRQQLVLVEAGARRMFDYEPPQHVGAARFYNRLLREGYSRRRVYDLEAGRCRDELLGSEHDRRLVEEEFVETVAALIGQLLSLRIEEVITQPWK